MFSSGFWVLLSLTLVLWGHVCRRVLLLDVGWCVYNRSLFDFTSSYCFAFIVGILLSQDMNFFKKQKDYKRVIQSLFIKVLYGSTFENGNFQVWLYIDSSLEWTQCHTGRNVKFLLSPQIRKEASEKTDLYSRALKMVSKFKIIISSLK